MTNEVGALVGLLAEEDRLRVVAALVLGATTADEVVAAADYRDALTTLESDTRVDLLLTDVVMPDRIHGFALARMALMRLTILQPAQNSSPTRRSVRFGSR